MKMNPISQQRKKLIFYLRSAWYFDKVYEKIILIILEVLGLWKILNLIFGI